MAAAAIVITMIGCCPERKASQHWEECVKACQTREDAVISNYNHCKDVAIEVAQTDLEVCFGLAGDAKAACIQRVRAQKLAAIQICDQTYNQEWDEAKKCALKCTAIDPITR